MDEWRQDARCRGLPFDLADALFFGGHRDREALTLCRQCPVTDVCLATAQRVETLRGNAQPFGIVGGLTAQERVVLLRRQRDQAGSRVG